MMTLNLIGHPLKMNAIYIPFNPLNGKDTGTKK